MTLDELVNETLTQKHRRLMQAKCPHEEVHCSSVTSESGRFENRCCLDCGKSWHIVNGETMKLGSSEPLGPRYDGTTMDK